MTGRELEQLMVRQFGPDFRDKVVVGTTESFRLGNCFVECGLVDPARLVQVRADGYGLWQFSDAR